VHPTDKLIVTLEAQTWETIMRVLSEAPHRLVALPIAEIQRQCVAQQRPLSVVPRPDERILAEAPR
jgi:hypothetical protein